MRRELWQETHQSEEAPLELLPRRSRLRARLIRRQNQPPQQRQIPCRLCSNLGPPRLALLELAAFERIGERDCEVAHVCRESFEEGRGDRWVGLRAVQADAGDGGRKGAEGGEEGGRRRGRDERLIGLLVVPRSCKRKGEKVQRKKSA